MHCYLIRLCTTYYFNYHFFFIIIHINMLWHAERRKHVYTGSDKKAYGWFMLDWSSYSSGINPVGIISERYLRLLSCGYYLTLITLIIVMLIKTKWNLLSKYSRISKILLKYSLTLWHLEWLKLMVNFPLLALFCHISTLSLFPFQYSSCTNII